MRIFFFAIVVAAGLCVLPETRSRAATTAAATQPASAPAAVPIPDLCRGAVDPYNQGEERDRFLQACGKDNELDEQEFQADKGKDKSFVRSFDRWDSMLTFDKNANKKIDWFEADAYRQDLRNRVLAAFDADKDGKLTGQERDSANRALAAGKVAMATASTRPSGGFWRGQGGMGGTGPWGRMDDAEAVKRYDTDGDGKLSDEERQAAWRAMREERARRMLEKYDRNGDGKLDEEETAAMRRGEGEQGDPRAQWEETVRKWQIKHFDEDGNGELDEKEKAQVKEFVEKFRAIGKEMELKVLDLDGDGQVTQEERRTVQRAFIPVALRMMAKGQKLMDLDGDGQVSAEERQAFADRLREGGQKWVEGVIGRYDADRDGRLNAKERDALVEGVRKDLQERGKKYDANGNGRLEPEEIEAMMEDFGRELGVVPEDKPPPARPGVQR